jgi:hypothetical protein
MDCQRTVDFEIFLIYVIATRRALSAIRNLVLSCAPHEREIVFTEHLDRWVNAAEAAADQVVEQPAGD